jgi:hypothetical protein
MLPITSDLSVVLGSGNPQTRVFRLSHIAELRAATRTSLHSACEPFPHLQMGAMRSGRQIAPVELDDRLRP